MKRTYPANIDGQIFYIDDDAFALLQNYLDQLKQTFTGPEGDEIVGDIESRIREHFANRIESGANVIVFADVNDVIATMGRPEELREEPEGECVGANTVHAEAEDTRKERSSEEYSFITINLPGRKRLYRNMQDKVFGGVFGGLAAYLGWNANIMRLLFAIITCFTYFWPLTIAYMIAWMIIPAAVTPRQILAMKGTPMNVNTVGQAVVETVTPPPYSEKDGNGGFVATFFSIIGKCLMGLFALLIGGITFASIVGAIAISVGIFSFIFFSSPVILTGLELYPMEMGWARVCAIIVGLAFVSVVGCSLVWGACSVIFHTKGMQSKTIITLTIISAMLLVAAVIFYAISTASI